MKKRILKCMALTLAIMLALPMLTGVNGSVVSAAAKASLSMKSKIIIGTDATFTLNVKNAGSSVKRMTWYTQNENIATVESTNDPATGIVTTIGKGTTYIKCKITYKNGKVVRPACKVTVKIPATGITINNAQDTENNRHVITVGETYDFNATITPSNANDKVYWSIGDKGKDYATVNSSGIVTGIKPGFVNLKATASMTADGAATSIISDVINIEVVNKTAKVLKSELISATKLTITFDSAIDPTTILGLNNKLLDTITIVPKADEKGKLASSLGDLTGNLSADGKILTIQSTNSFNGIYGVFLSSNIKTIDNIQLSSYNENLNLYDNQKPSYDGFTVDVTGLVVSLNFSETMDFTNLVVSDAKIATSGQTIEPATITMLNTKTNYLVSADKKSLIIDLTTMSSVDRNKMFQVNLSGIKDIAGNSPATIPLLAYFRTDTTAKPQAQLMTLQRTGYNTITATFSRAIKSPGFIRLSNGEYAIGAIDANDATKVNYTLSPMSVVLTGVQEVSIANWDSYNVAITDTTSQIPTKRSVNFTLDTTKPVLTNAVFEIRTENNVDLNVLTLTFSENVSLISNTGVLSSKLITSTNDIYSNRNISYAASVKDNQVTLVLNQDQINESGIYTITIPAGLVRDAYNNMNETTNRQIIKNAAVASTLPAPKDIVQSSENPNVLYVYFDRKIDPTTAQSISNYSLIGTGITIIAAELTDNTSSGATVKLTLQAGCLTTTTIYPITITGIKGFQDSYSTMEKYQETILLNENSAPLLLSYRYSSPTTIIYTFNEAIKGTASFQAIQNNTNIFSSASVNGNAIIITLNQSPVINSSVLVVPTQFNSITDTVGNAAAISSISVPTTLQ